MRTDNGQGINNQIVYQITSANTNFGSFQYPSHGSHQPAEQLEHVLRLRSGPGVSVSGGLHPFRQGPHSWTGRRRRFRPERHSLVQPLHRRYLAHQTFGHLSYGHQLRCSKCRPMSSTASRSRLSIRMATRRRMKISWPSAKGRSRRTGLSTHARLRHRQQHCRRPQVSLRSLLRRH